MDDKQWTLFWRVIKYELGYFLRKFQFWESLVFLGSIIAIIITGLGDTQSFFIDEHSPIPLKWKFFKNSQIVLILSICVLALPPIALWCLDQKQKTKDKIELLKTVKDNVLPSIDLDLKKLQTSIKTKFKPKGKIRISLWIPVQKRFFKWNLEMVCRTPNIPDKELQASFKLREGVIGYTYLKNRRKFALEFIDVSIPTNLPEGYVELEPDNKLLINPDIKVVLAIAAFQENSSLGLLAIDTDNIDDFSIIENNELHSMVVSWIVHNSGVIGLLWRMKNNI